MTLKTEALNAYGGAICYCCGEKELLFLGLDHIERNGSEHRKEENISGGGDLYWWVKKHNYPEGFRVACHNCNMGSYYNNGVCPHKRHLEEGR